MLHHVDCSGDHDILKEIYFNTHNKNAHNFCISCSQVKLHLGWPRVFGPLRSPKNPWLAKMVKL